MSLALITGGSGYFGSLLLRKLRDAGIPSASSTWSMRRTALPTSRSSRGTSAILKPSRRLAAVPASFTTTSPRSPSPRTDDCSNPSTSTGRKTCSRRRIEAKVQKVVYTSSSAGLRHTQVNPVTEETPPSPGEAYGRAKYEGEKRCHGYAGKGLDVTIIRPRTILGHGRLGIFQILFEWIRTGHNVPVLGHGDNVYQFVHADDLAEACILAGERPGSAVYNIGADRYGTMRQVLETLCQHAGTGSKVKSIPMTPALLGMKLTSLLGLSPLGSSRLDVRPLDVLRLLAGEIGTELAGEVLQRGDVP